MNKARTAIPADAQLATKRDAAGALTAAELAAETNAALARCERVLPTVLQLIEDYAPAAPVVLKREAALRAAGYLLEANSGLMASSRFGAITKEALGPLNREWNTSHANFFRRSGAAGILTRHRRRIAATVREA